jgi:hypothetical protein
MPAAAIDLGKADIVLPPERFFVALSIIAEGWRGEGRPTQEERPASPP